MLASFVIDRTIVLKPDPVIDPVQWPGHGSDGLTRTKKNVLDSFRLSSNCKGRVIILAGWIHRRNSCDGPGKILRTRSSSMFLKNLLDLRAEKIIEQSIGTSNHNIPLLHIKFTKENRSPTLTLLNPIPQRKRVVEKAVLCWWPVNKPFPSENHVTAITHVGITQSVSFKGNNTGSGWS